MSILKKQGGGMMLIIELFLLCYGIYALLTARFKIGRSQAVKGPQARVLGGICLTPFPLTFLAAFLYYHLYLVRQHLGLLPQTFAFIAATVLVFVVVLVLVLGNVFYRGQTALADTAKSCGRGISPKRRALVVVGVCLFPVLVMVQISNGAKADVDTVLSALLGSLLGVGLVSLMMSTMARFKEENHKRSEAARLGKQGFLSLAGLLIALLIVGFLAYLMMKSRFLEPPVSKDTAASLHEAGIRTENYGVLLNSVKQQVGDVERRMQTDADALNRGLR
jgi:hypothetical protein